MRSVVPASARSWVSVHPDSQFPIQNIPFGRALLPGDEVAIVTRIGDSVLPIEGADDLLAFGVEGLSSLRAEIIEHLTTPKYRRDIEPLLLKANEVEMLLPVAIPAFVDFYSGINHASNVGRMFRPDQPALLPNYRHVPVAYNGRASSVVPSGTDIRRPSGQTKGPNDELPTFGPTKELDFELELGFFAGTGNNGKPISPKDALNAMLGFVLVNDWSARDVQRWEYQPLGPFLAKSFGTSISPWVVTIDALAPFLCEGLPQEPMPLPYLQGQPRAHLDLRLEVSIQTPKMTRPQVVTRTRSNELYWSFAQQLAHQTSNGTPIEPGDLYASGTISGTESGTYGSLLEATWRGTQPITLDETGETRTFLQDGDTVTFSGYGQGDGFRVGFGELRNRVVSGV